MDVICAEAPFFLSVQMLSAIDDISIASALRGHQSYMFCRFGHRPLLSYRNMDRLLILLCLFFPRSGPLFELSDWVVRMGSTREPLLRSRSHTSLKPPAGCSDHKSNWTKVSRLLIVNHKSKQSEIHMPHALWLEWDSPGQ